MCARTRVWDVGPRWTQISLGRICGRSTTGVLHATHTHDSTPHSCRHARCGVFRVHSLQVPVLRVRFRALVGAAIHQMRDRLHKHTRVHVNVCTHSMTREASKPREHTMALTPRVPFMSTTSRSNMFAKSPMQASLLQGTWSDHVA